MCEPENSTDINTPKKTTTRYTTNKMKEIETTTTPLVQRLDNTRKGKVIETSWARLWKEIKKWSYKDVKITEESQKLSASTILSYMNAPLMDNFLVMKEIISQFIVSIYHIGKLYFDIPVEISSDIIYRLIRLSNKGEPVPVRLNLGLVENLTGRVEGKNS